MQWSETALVLRICLSSTTDEDSDDVDHTLGGANRNRLVEDIVAGVVDSQNICAEVQ